MKAEKPFPNQQSKVERSQDLLVRAIRTVMAHDKGVDHGVDLVGNLFVQRKLLAQVMGLALGINGIKGER